MKKSIIENDIEQKKEQAKLQPQLWKKESTWNTIKKFLLSYWARFGPKV